MAAFERALELGADMVELDVRRTADGELIVFHDPDCDAVPVNRQTISDLSQRAGVTPARLEEVLAWASKRIALNVELKEDGYVELVASMLAGFSGAGGELLVSSFLDAVLAQLPGQLAYGLLLETSADRAVERAEACGAGALVVQMRLVTEALIEAAVSAGLRFLVWDFLAAEHATLLRDPRLAGVITDDVPGALDALR